MNAETLRDALPKPGTVQVVRQHYRTPIGELPRVTGVLDILGLSKNALIAWSANMERGAALEACAEVYAEGVDGGPAEFADAVEARLGKARAHQREKNKAAEIGTLIHQEIQRRTHRMMGLQVGPEPVLPDPALWAVMAWEDWFKTVGPMPIVTEQPIYSVLGYAGTIDLIACDMEGRPGIIDYKSSKAIYEDYHIQVAAYVRAAREFIPIEWARIVRVPKNLDDPAFEVRELGEVTDWNRDRTVTVRRVTEERLLAAFDGALMVHNALKG